jgi:hypothetical protein
MPLAKLRVIALYHVIVHCSIICVQSFGSRPGFCQVQRTKFYDKAVISCLSSCVPELDSVLVKQVLRSALEAPFGNSCAKKSPSNVPRMLLRWWIDTGFVKPPHWGLPVSTPEPSPHVLLQSANGINGRHAAPPLFPHISILFNVSLETTKSETTAISIVNKCLSTYFI